jgi:1,4-alpha-glucan branching enzyme
MAKQSLIMTILAHHPYIRHVEDEQERLPQLEPLFSAISDTYLPLLRVFSRLEADGTPFHAVMLFSPTLCSLLADGVVQSQYIRWLDRVIAFGKAETAGGGPVRKRLASLYLRQAEENRSAFIDTYGGDLLRAFERYVSRGNIELLATCGTYAFLPHYADMPEILNAQIETGLMAHKAHFSVAPDGFWLPNMGYTPGLEKALRSYGLNYTVLEAHGLLFARPFPENGIFAPARCANSLALFGRDLSSHREVAGHGGFVTNPVYRNQNRDAAFEMSAGNLGVLFPEGDARVPSGYKYWAKGGEDVPYDPEAAGAQAREDARLFLKEKAERLAAAAPLVKPEGALLLCAFNANVFGGMWHEGVLWLEEVFRQAAQMDSLELTTCLPLLDNQFSLQKIEPYPSASTGGGYGEDLLDNSNARLIRYVRKVCERMVNLADRFPGEKGLKARTLNLAAKEALLAQSSDWPRLLNRRIFPEYVEERFREHVTAFSTIFDSLGSNSISTEWLTKYEKKHPLFPWLNYRVFGRKRG